MLNKTVTAILVVIGVVILMTAAASLLPVLNASGLNSSDLCTGASPACFYNASRSTDCTANNETPADTITCGSAGAEMPLSPLFNQDGVIPLVFGAAIVILAILFLILIIKKKSGK